MLTKEKSLHGQLERGSEIDSSVKDTRKCKLVEKGAVQPIKQSHTHTCNKSYVSGPQKWRRLEVNHRPEIPQFLPRATTLQDGGSLYVTKHYMLTGSW